MKTQAFISGEWVDSEIGTTFSVTDPASGELIAEVADCGPKLTSFAIEAAHDAFPKWKKLTAKERAEILLRIKAQLLANVGSLANIISRENVN
jgi:succinate-semialdehyde dehydrogenase/glutarate-semialdehyde dehydrogenase